MIVVKYWPMSNFSQSTILAVWNKGRFIPGKDPNQYRADFCGKMIKYDHYGLETALGWEIDHIIPLSKGGKDDLGNLQPLYWENNRHKGDNYPNWSCKVRG